MNIYITVFTLAAVLSLVAYLWLAIVGFKRSVPWGILILLLSPISAIVFAMTNWFDARKAFLTYLIAFVVMCGMAILIYAEVGMGNMQQIAERMHAGKLGPGQAYALITKAMSHTGAKDLFAEETPVAAADTNAAKPNPVAIAGSPPPAQATTELAQNQVASVPGNPVDTAGSNAKAGATPETKTDVAPMPAPDKAVDKAAAKPAEVKPEKKQYPTPDQIQPDPLAQKRKKEEVNTIKVSMDKMGKLTGHYFIITLKTGNEQRGLLRKVDDTKLYLDRKLYGGKFEYRIRKDQVKSIQMLKHVPEER